MTFACSTMDVPSANQARELRTPHVVASSASPISSSNTPAQARAIRGVRQQGGRSPDARLAKLGHFNVGRAAPHRLRRSHAWLHVPSRCGGDLPGHRSRGWRLGDILERGTLHRGSVRCVTRPRFGKGLGGAAHPRIDHAVRTGGRTWTRFTRSYGGSSSRSK